MTRIPASKPSSDDEPITTDGLTALLARLAVKFAVGPGRFLTRKQTILDLESNYDHSFQAAASIAEGGGHE